MPSLKDEKSEFLTFFGVLQSPKWVENQNFRPTKFLVMVSRVNRWHVKTLANKKNEKLYFLLWAILGTFRAISPKRGPKSKIRYINFWALGRSVFP